MRSRQPGCRGGASGGRRLCAGGGASRGRAGGRLVRAYSKSVGQKWGPNHLKNVCFSHSKIWGVKNSFDKSLASPSWQWQPLAPPPFPPVPGGPVGQGCPSSGKGYLV